MPVITRVCHSALSRGIAGWICEEQTVRFLSKFFQSICDLCGGTERQFEVTVSDVANEFTRTKKCFWIGCGRRVMAHAGMKMVSLLSFVDVRLFHC